MSTTSNLKRVNLTIKAYEYLKEAIISGEFAENYLLSEQEIGLHLGCSRTPVREAFRQLQKEGYVNFIPNRGVTVMSLSIKDIFEIFQIREALESFSAAIACEKMTDEVLKTFSKKLRDEKKSIEQLNKIGYQFHDELIKWSGNTRINYILSTYKDQIRRINMLSEKVPGSLELSHKQHLAILTALEARDQLLVEKEMRKHIISTKESTLASLQNYGLSRAE